MPRALGCFQPLGRGKNREEAGVEHRKEPRPSGRGPAGWARFSARSQPFTVRRRYLAHGPSLGRRRRPAFTLRREGENTKQTQFLASQLQSMSHGWFCARRGPGKRGKSGPTSRAGALLLVPAAARRLSRRLSRVQRGLFAPLVGQPFYGWSPPHVAPFGARPPPAGERGLGWDKNRPCQRPIPLPPLPEPLSHQFEISNSSAINKIVLPPPSDSPSAMLLWARKSAGPSGSDRPAYPGRDIKSSPWPPSVSRSTDRVTQNNGIDPKPFWRLRAIPKEPHPIKPRPGRLKRSVVEAQSAARSASCRRRLRFALRRPWTRPDRCV